MTRVTEVNTLKRGVSAAITFNGDETNKITVLNGDNTLYLPHSFVNVPLEGYFHINLGSPACNSTTFTTPTTTTDNCVEAYGLPWRWSTFMGCSSISTMPLNSYTHRPSSWSNVSCSSRYKKKWIKEPDLEPDTTSTTMTACDTSCNKGPITWVVSTAYWSVSTNLGANIDHYPYRLKYSNDGLTPFTVHVEHDTAIEVKACQDIYCEQIPNSLIIYTDQTPSMIQVHTDILDAVTSIIKPRFSNYLLANGHPVSNINNIVKVLPITSKRYLYDIANTGITSMQGDGNTNISFIFTDIPTAYTTSCTNSLPTTTFQNDLTTFRNSLSSVYDGSYKATFFAVTSAANIDNICPSLSAQFNALETGTNINYPVSLTDKLADINFNYNVLYKNNIMPFASANTSYYADLIIKALQAHNVNLETYTPYVDTSTLCRVLTAHVPPGSIIRIYTANRFVPLNSVVKFQNISLGLGSVTSITVDFDDGIVVTYTGANVYDDFYVTYSNTGYKTLNITSVTNTGSTKTQTFPRIVNVVSYYD